MFGIGGAELIVVVLVLLLFVGPDELPKVARTVSKGLTDLRRAANVAQAELQETMQELTREVDALQRDVQDVGRDLNSVHEELAKQPPAPAAADDDVTVIPRRKPADVKENPADPWQLAHRPPEGVDIAAIAPDAPPEAPDAAVVADANPAQAEPEPLSRPAFRMPGGPIAGTVSRSTGSAVSTAAAAAGLQVQPEVHTEVSTESTTVPQAAAAAAATPVEPESQHV